MGLLNWIQILKPLTQQGWFWTPEGKLKPKNMMAATETPWIHAPVAIPGIIEEGLDCGLLTIYHNQVFGGRAAHSFCMECYKVVVVIKSKDDACKMANWQRNLGVACKVGAERRNYTQRCWGAYFYCRGVEEGRERYKMVKEWVDENLEEGTDVFLKRACTEFEQHMGDSDKWEKLPHQDEIEAEGKDIFEYTPVEPIQPMTVVHHVLDIWDQWERDNQPPVTYHEEETSEEND